MFRAKRVEFVPVIFALAIMRPAEFFATGNRARTPLLQSIRDGLAYARATKTVAVVLAMLFVVSTVSINFNVVLPVLARNTMHGGAQTYASSPRCSGWAHLREPSSPLRANASRAGCYWARPPASVPRR